MKEVDALKKEIASQQPLKRRKLQELKQYYRVALTYSSNAIEGNSLSDAETKAILEEGIAIGGKLVKEHLEVLGHSDAYDLLYKLTKNHAELTEKDICKLHKLFYFRIDPKLAGKYRKEQVFITGTDFVPPAPDQVSGLMKQFAAEISTLKAKYHSIEFAALLHLKLVTIHPFIDGNGRIARLVMNLALMQAGYPITIIPVINREDYINCIKQIQLNNDPMPFINFISTMVYESANDYLRMLKALAA